VEKRDEAEEAKRFFSAETAEFPGIVEGRILFWNSGIKTVVAGGWLRRNRVSSDATAGWTRTRPEDTGAGSYRHRGTKCTDIPG
jgi:hypothetical protein